MLSGEGVPASFQQMLAMVLFVLQAMCLVTEQRLNFTGTNPKVWNPGRCCRNQGRGDKNYLALILEIAGKGHY